MPDTDSGVSAVTVCNAALSRLGEARIFDLSDDSAAGRACKLYMAPAAPLAIDELLRSHPWNFAVNRATLVQVTTAPAFGFAHAYTLPAECLRILEVNGISGSGTPGEDWEIEDGHLLHDASTVEVRFIKRVTNMSLFDALALEALIVLLASKIAPAIQGGSTTKADALKEEFFRMVAPIARRIDSNETRNSKANQMDTMLSGSRAIQARGCGG